MKTLNIHSPEVPQGDGIIIGSHKGLIALKHAIERVLDEGCAVTVPLQTSKGEDFVLRVAQSHIGIEHQIQEPFTHEFYKDDDGMKPQQVLDELARANVLGLKSPRRKRWK